MVNCGEHGERISAVVCRHHLGESDSPRGFIENSTLPHDLQAWCDACEELFEREGALTDAFRKFNSFAIVCVECYAQLKARHSPER